MKKNMILLRAISLIGVLVLAVSCTAERLNQKMEDNTAVRISPRLPEEEIRSAILRYTPVGSSIDEVLAFAQKRLKHKYMHDKLLHEKLPSVYERDPNNPEGINQIGVNLGGYGFNPFLRTSVYVDWNFDKNDHLKDVVVKKEIDGL